ncbi:GTP 3',8-cyclase MoaA [Parvularcula marina]|uniref:GTP 3',8-cyclase MoaA n=1 Tax=Parvularcula marina TaxID=2292771 RepID=UPI0035163673
MPEGKEKQRLRDGFGREITYLRLSVTDRCDLRCTYCMAEKMTFLPKADVLSLEELYMLSDRFIRRGVRKIRITGGEPLVRRDILTLMTMLGKRVSAGELEELTLTTNGTQLVKYAEQLKDIGVKRVNISLDTLDRDVFKKLSRRDALDQVMEGIEAARAAGLKVKINAVALKDTNEDELPRLIEWSHEKGMDVTLIEVMPLGDIEALRSDQYLPLTAVREKLEAGWTLTDLDFRTGGPARYVRVRETGGILGFITPLTNNFCAGCNRVRVTCTGEIYTCLGSDGKLDLRSALRSATPQDALDEVLDRAMIGKPERHDFDNDRHDAHPAVVRHMSVTGG